MKYLDFPYILCYNFVQQQWEVYSIFKAIMTVAQTAEYLKVCDKNARRLIAKKELAASKAGSFWRIIKDDIDMYLDENLNKNN